MSGIVISFERRKHTRVAVRWSGYCELGNATIVGEVCDWGQHGVFFRPEEAYLDGEFLHGPEIIEHLDPCDTITVVVDIGDGQPAIRLTGTVRWLGSSTHGYGFGVQCEVAPARAAA